MNHAAGAANLDEEQVQERGGPDPQRAFVPCALCAQFFIILVYAAFSGYGHFGNAMPTPVNVITTGFYDTFMDVHVMIFIGFGYLMTFLKRHGYGSVGLNFFVAALAMEWGMVAYPIIYGLFHDHTTVFKSHVPLDVVMLIEGDFAAATVLITFGGLLGKISPLQLMVVALVEVVVYAINFELVAKIGTLDVGGSLVIHMFGAYFGLACSYVMTPSSAFGHKKNEASYNSDMFAMIGTVFLWIYWPSFVTALIPEGRDIAAVHTVLALCGSCVVAFATSFFFEGKFDMVHIQNATLAGGVAIGSAADMEIGLAGAVAVGCAAGFWSTYGYVKITPWLESKGLHDTCGIHNLHGMPGMMGGLVSVLAVAGSAADKLEPADDQAGRQILGLLCSLAMALVGGLLTGKLAMTVCPALEDLFEDGAVWVLEEAEHTAATPVKAMTAAWTEVSGTSADAEAKGEMAS
jgi:ammonium transporter Rh